MWVRGISDRSYLTVPSLNITISCFALSAPFSSGSGDLFFDISPSTHFISRVSLSPMLWSASATSDLKSISISVTHVVFLLHFGHRGLLTSMLHDSHFNNGCVNIPHEHLFLNVFILQVEQIRCPIWTFIVPTFPFWMVRPVLRSLFRPSPSSSSTYSFAFWSDLRFPPASPIGKRTCGAGFISRLSDFSGRPILAPILIGARARMIIPLTFKSVSMIFASGTIHVFLRFLSMPRHAIRGSGSSMYICFSRTVWGTRSTSRMSFIFSSTGNESFSAYFPFFWRYSASSEKSSIEISCHRYVYFGCSGTL